MLFWGFKGKPFSDSLGSGSCPDNHSSAETYLSFVTALVGYIILIYWAFHKNNN
jgi:hypothetical protein